MSNYQNNDQVQSIPSLVPLNRKKAEIATMNAPSEKISNTNVDVYPKSSKDAIKKIPEKSGNLQNEKNPMEGKFKQANPQKIHQFEKRSKQKLSLVNKKQGQKSSNERSRQNEKSKFLIAEMLNKISVKNLTEQLYPVSNQVIQQLLSEIDLQIAQLTTDAQKKQKALDVNPYNLHLKKELQVVKRQIDHCSTIKQLYCEKINYRNKIQILQGEILNYRNQNRELKVKVSRGIEMIQNYKHNLPCEGEKQLKQKLSVCESNLAKEKEMRENLEKNIGSIITNFKKLYQEADQARNIVTKKLAEIQIRQKKLRKYQLQQDQNDSQEQNNPPARRVTTIQQTQQKRAPSSSQIQSNLEATQGYRKNTMQSQQLKGPQNNFRKTSRDELRKSVTPAAKRQKMAQAPTIKKQQSQKMPSDQTFSLEDRIKKMRSNQNLMHRIYKN